MIDWLVNWLYTNPGKEKRMGIVMKGVWTRKNIEFPDTQTMFRAKLYASNWAPWTIKSTPDLKKEYLELYGADEEANLIAGNMVQSTTQRFVVGGTWVPDDPKPSQTEPFAGKPRPPLSHASVLATTTVGELDQILDEFGDRLINKLIGSLTK